jgi:hypothetical protein
MITFARPRWKYDSYADFWRLVELSEFPTCFVDEMDMTDPEQVYITTPMNGDYQAHLENHTDRRCTIFLWMLERPGGSGTVAQFRADNQAHLDAGRIDAILSSDKGMASECGYQYVPMYSHPDLGTIGDVFDKKYDAIGLMAYSPRRGFLFSDPGAPRAKLPNGCTQAPNGWGDVRDHLLRTSRIGINVHQDSVNYSEPLRFALFAAYGLPIVTERIPEDDLYTPYVLQSDYGNFLDMLAYGRRNYEQFLSDGIAYCKSLCYDHTFREGVEKYL